MTPEGQRERLRAGTSAGTGGGTSEMTEGQLLAAVKGGDRRAMRSLYDRYAGYAMATAMRYVADQDDVRDVVQDSFVKVFTTIGRFDFRGEGSLKAWINRIVANQAIDHLRSRQRLVFVSDIPNDAEDDCPDVDPVPPEVLTQLIAQLPTGYRLVLNLFVFEQLSHKEIAQRLGIGEKTSASQYNRAKRKLAEYVKDYLKQQER